MKKFNKILMSLCAVLLLTTGCSSNALKTAYTKMSVGTGEDQISGYTMNLRLFGLYNGEKIRESVRVQNYEGKNFKVTYSTDLEKIYYVIDGVNYIPMMTLTADAGKILTNGETSVYSITVEADEVNLWREIPDKVN